MLITTKNILSLSKVTIATSSMTLGIVISQPVYAFNIISDDSWLAHDTYIDGWRELDFNDNGWAFAAIASSVYNPMKQQTITPDDSRVLDKPTDAKFIWTGDSDTVFLPYNPIDYAFLRKTFYLGTYSLESAEAVISGNDDYTFYINGELVVRNNNGYLDFPVSTINLKPFLKPGKNVFAIYGENSRTSNPGENILQWVAFDAEIKPVPEPITGLVIAAGFGGVVLKRNKDKSKKS